MTLVIQRATCWTLGGNSLMTCIEPIQYIWCVFESLMITKSGFLPSESKRQFAARDCLFLASCFYVGNHRETSLMSIDRGKSTIDRQQVQPPEWLHQSGIVLRHLTPFSCFTRTYVMHERIVTYCTQVSGVYRCVLSEFAVLMFLWEKYYSEERVLCVPRNKLPSVYSHSIYCVIAQFSHV